jgi:hypothetical protein
MQKNQLLIFIQILIIFSVINIPVDEGYAYDVLAIAEVKIIKNITNATENFLSLNDSIERQVGKSLHFKIVNSDEYQALLYSNAETFNAVEKARYGEISAKEVGKINLQNKFFPNSKVLEKKS